MEQEIFCALIQQFEHASVCRQREVEKMRLSDKGNHQAVSCDQKAA